MLNLQQIKELEPKVFALMALTLAFLLGALMFVAMVAIMTDWELVSTGIKMMTLFGAMTGFMLLCLAFVVPKVMTANPTLSHRTDSDTESEEEASKLVATAFGALFARQLIFCAMIDGAIFLNVMTFMLERSIVSLVLIGLGLLLLLAAFPFRGRALARIDKILHGG